MSTEPDRASGGCGPRAARWLAVVLAVVVAISLPLTLGARAAASVLFSPASVSQILSQNLIDSGLLRQVVIQGLFARETDGLLTASDFGRLMTYADEQQRQAAADTVVPPGWAQEQLQALVAGFYTWLSSDAAAPDLVVDFAPVRAHLLNSGAADLVDLIWSTWPNCTSAQASQIEAAINAGESPQLITCRPPEPTAGLFKATMVLGLESEVQTMPDKIPVADLAGAGSNADLQQIRRTLNGIHLLATWLWLVPASLLGLIVALVVRSWTGLFRWWGIPLLVGGLLGIVLSVLAGSVGSGWLDAQLATAATDAPIALRQALSGTITQAYQVMVRAFFRGSFVEAGAAGVLTLLGVLIKPQSPGADSVEPPPIAAHVDAGSDDEPPSGMFG